jgi:ABC-2 type transport system permease protein
VKSLRDVFVIARREFLERVKTKWFVAITILGPIFLIAMIVVPSLIMSRAAVGAKVDIVDHTGVLAQPLEQALTAVQWKPAIVAADTSNETEMERIRSRAINGFIVIPKDALDGGEIVYRGDNGSSQMVEAVLRAVINPIVHNERGKRAGIPPEKLASVLQKVNFKPLHTDGKTEGSSGGGAFIIAYMLAFILYMVITLYGVAVMRSVVTEKTSRVMELMVAAVKPRALMAGKILGVGGAGLLQVTIWLVVGAIALAYRDAILSSFGVSGAEAALPELNVLQVLIVILYFVLGYFFYAAMFAAMGAMVSSDQDTQQVQMPVTMVLIIGVLCMTMITNDPRGAGSAVMTQIPFWSPILMPMRFVLGGASLGELALSLGILVISTMLVVRAAAKIYRVGVLMYGKRPGLRELARWLRH